MEALQLLFTLIGAIGGLVGLTSLLLVRANRRKVYAEADKIGVDAAKVLSGEALRMYELARKEAQEAKQEAKDCREMVRALHDHVDHLERIMRDAGLNPPPFRFQVLRAIQEKPS